MDLQRLTKWLPAQGQSFPSVRPAPQRAWNTSYPTAAGGMRTRSKGVSGRDSDEQKAVALTQDTW
jgi:hypothetical protein